MVQCEHIKTGEKRSFNDAQWKLLGPLHVDGHKSNWKPIATQETSSVNVEAIKIPATGQKTQVTEDSAQKRAKLYEKRMGELFAIDPRVHEMDLGNMSEEKYQEVKSGVIAVKKQTADISEKSQLVAENIEQAIKEAFLNAVSEKKLTKNMIKDYFDKPEVAEKYDNKANITTLSNQLGEKLAWNIETLNANF